jgi:hypothetical protein
MVAVAHPLPMKLELYNLTLYSGPREVYKNGGMRICSETKRIRSSGSSPVYLIVEWTSSIPRAACISHFGYSSCKAIGNPHEPSFLSSISDQMSIQKDRLFCTSEMMAPRRDYGPPRGIAGLTIGRLSRQHGEHQHP